MPRGNSNPQVPEQENSYVQQTSASQEYVNAELIANEPLEYQGARILVGWLSEAEAVRALLGREPGANDDVSGLRHQATDKRDRVASRPTYTPSSPIVAATDEEILDRIAARPEVHAHFGNMRWSVAMVDLTQVISFQKLINLGSLEERLAPIRMDPAQLFEFCLPSAQPSPPLGAFQDPDGKGFTVSSLNPNLRIAGGQIQRVQIAQAEGLPTTNCSDD